MDSFPERGGATRSHSDLCIYTPSAYHIPSPFKLGSKKKLALEIFQDLQIDMYACMIMYVHLQRSNTHVHIHKNKNTVCILNTQLYVYTIYTYNSHM